MRYRISDEISQATQEHDNLGDAILEAKLMNWRYGFPGLAVQVRGRRDWLTPSIRDDRYYPAYPYTVSSAMRDIALAERCAYVAVTHEQKILAFVHDVIEAPCSTPGLFEITPEFSDFHDDGKSRQ